MKWLIYLLLIGNLVFFAWQTRQAERPVTEPSRSDTARPVSAHIQRLLLLSEVDTSELPPPVSPRPRAESDIAMSEPGNMTRRHEFEREDPPPQPVPEPRPESKPDPFQQSTAVQPEPRMDAARSDIGIPQPAVDTPEPIMIVDADEPRDLASTRLPKPVFPAPLSPALPSDTCYTLGPFPEDGDIQAVGVRLTDQGLTVSDRWLEERRPRSYWVYLPRLADVATARAKLSELKDAGVRDYARVTGGKMINAISLGLFSLPRTAEKRVTQLQKFGYEPRVQTRYRQIRERWLDIRVPEGISLDMAPLAWAFPDLPKPVPAACP